MRTIVRGTACGFFLRDAESVEQSQIVVLIGSRKEPLRLPFYVFAVTSISTNKYCWQYLPVLYLHLGIVVGSSALNPDFRFDNRIVSLAEKVAVAIKFKEYRLAVSGI